MPNEIIPKQEQGSQLSNVASSLASKAEESNKLGILKEFLSTINLLKMDSIDSIKDQKDRYEKYLSDPDLSKEDRQFYEDKITELNNNLLEAQRIQSANILKGLQVTGLVAAAAFAPKILNPIAKYIFRKK